MMPTSPQIPADDQPTNAGIVGKMSFVDTSISFAAGSCKSGKGGKGGRTVTTGATGVGSGVDGAVGGATAFLGIRTLFLQSVYVAGAASIFSVNGTTLVSASAEFCSG